MLNFYKWNKKIETEEDSLNYKALNNAFDKLIEMHKEERERINLNCERCENKAKQKTIGTRSDFMSFSFCDKI